MATDKAQHPQEWLRPASQSSKHYSTPEGYFDGLASAIMERIDNEPIGESIQPTHWWVKVKPLVYLAACFVGLMLTFSLVQYLSSQSIPTSVANQATAEPSEDDWAVFYTEYADRDYEKELDYTL